eukprot:13647313-Ditylum_brightwellii.AAC.1
MLCLRNVRTGCRSDSCGSSLLTAAGITTAPTGHELSPALFRFGIGERIIGRSMQLALIVSM